MTVSFSFHLATPPGEGGIAVFELFGDGAEDVLRRVFRGRGLPAAGCSRLGELHEEDGRSIDEALLSRVPEAGMWCRLPGWTLSVHGGPWIQERTRELLVRHGGERLDRRGVLLRAVERGALDAVQAAAFELLVAARTERAAAFFLRHHEGELSRAIRDLLVLLDEKGPAALAEVGARLGDLIAGSHLALRLAYPLRLLIAGRPNSGKSTLFNRLAERERAVVSPQEGTTRDLLRETIAIADVPVEISDSAGLRELAADPVEAEAIRRVAEEDADAIIYLLRPPWRLEDGERRFVLARPESGVLLVGNFRDVEDTAVPGDAELVISAREGTGVDALLLEVARRFLSAAPQATGAATPDQTAPFTKGQLAALSAAHHAAMGAAPPSFAVLDEVRACLVHCLESSWPDDGRMSPDCRDGAVSSRSSSRERRAYR